MALSGALTRAGHPPTSVRTTAKVHIEKGDAGFSITRIDLSDTDLLDYASVGDIAGGLLFAQNDAYTTTNVSSAFTDFDPGRQNRVRYDGRRSESLWRTGTSCLMKSSIIWLVSSSERPDRWRFFVMPPTARTLPPARQSAAIRP